MRSLPFSADIPSAGNLRTSSDRTAGDETQRGRSKKYEAKTHRPPYPTAAEKPPGSRGENRSDAARKTPNAIKKVPSPAPKTKQGRKTKNRTENQRGDVELPGLEPRTTEPKSAVLPLHHSSNICSKALQRYTKIRKYKLLARKIIRPGPFSSAMGPPSSHPGRPIPRETPRSRSRNTGNREEGREKTDRTEQSGGKDRYPTASTCP